MTDPLVEVLDIVSRAMRIAESERAAMTLGVLREADSLTTTPEPEPTGGCLMG